MKWVALVSLIVANFVWLPAPVVRVRSGLVRGRVGDSGRFYQYFGIPYATVDDSNRFRAPLPPPQWDGVFEAIEENIRCPQQLVGSVVIGDPDCLKLNVYTPTRSTGLLPVMVYIHGGCFFEGTGSGYLYGADFLVEQDVVFVGINYRLNVEGFLCLGIDEAPGNAGLKDQIAALRWIRDNIKAFGGDPNQVTVFGESAGAVSTSYLILSPAARGLFHKAILQSGSTLAPWALQHDPIQTASLLAKELGYYTKDPYELYKIFSNRTVPELINAIKYSETKNYITAETLFVPCIEKPIPGVEPAMTQHSIDTISSGNYSKIPMIIGFNNHEGMYFVAKDYGTAVRRVDASSLIQPDLHFFNEHEKNATVNGLLEHYFSKYGEDDDKTMGMVELYSDLHFKFPSLVESELYARSNDQPMFHYVFKYSGYINLPKLVSLFGGWEGATHADELFYLFKPYSIPMPHRYLEHDMIRRMVTLWTNFAKYSDPTPARSPLLPLRWRPSRRLPVALVIDSALTTASMWDHVAAPAFWNRTYARHRRSHAQATLTYAATAHTTM